MQVGYYVYSGGQSTPAGVAPAIIGPSANIGCAGTGGSCTFTINVAQTGDTMLWLVTSSTGNATAPTSSHSESITCTANHVHGDDQSHICHFLASTNGSYTITNGSSVSSFWNAGVIYELRCAESPSSECIIDQGPAYQDTAGTGSAGTSTAGSITTSHQLNELIIGGFTQNDVASTSNPTQGSPFVICPPEISPACSQESGFGRSFSVMERYNSTATGTFQASTSWTTLNNTAGFTMSIY